MTDFTRPAGATPLDPDTLEGLLPDLTTQVELNEFEERNIYEAVRWVFGRPAHRRDILTDKALRDLHRRMFDRTWQWAGTYRVRETNIGIAPFQIPTAVRNLCLDVREQIAHDAYPPIELTARFHHSLVSIHLFPNGNGRHARLAADCLCLERGWPVLSWGAESLTAAGAARREYIAALREADAHDFGRLIRFVRK